MKNLDIRWQQRFQNFEKALANLFEAQSIENPSVVERAGIIQFFQIAFELGWKTMKDFLNDSGYDVRSPRDTIKQAAQHGIINDADGWFEMLEVRNELAHIYDDEIAEEAVEKIRLRFTQYFQDVNQWLKNPS